MTPDHINLCATDVAALARTFVRHFAFEVVDEGRVPDGGDGPKGAFAMLRNRAGFLLVVTQIDPGGGSTYPRGFHVGLSVGTADAVRTKHADLSESGFRPRAVNTFSALGADWTAFYCPVGDGIEIEISACSRPVAQLAK